MYGRGGEGALGKGRVLTMNLRQTSLACRPAVCHLQPRLSSHAGQEEWEGEKGGLRVGMREREKRPDHCNHSGPQLPPTIRLALETNPKLLSLL